jgi:orc1/cdc6 family replication initiation protein
MITDARVLRQEFVPGDLEHRDAETTYLSETLAPIADGETPETVIMYGPSGVGKTCVAKYMGETLRQEVLDAEFQYVNCWQHYSRYRALHRILEGLGQTLDIHRQSTPRDELFERLRQYGGPPCVVVLDEVDQLEDTRLLYHLHELPQFSMILIANREEAILRTVDERLASRLTGSERIRFNAYNEDELVSIMAARVRWGLVENAIREDQLRRIADTAAGDARIALSVLRSAARRADQTAENRITTEHVESAIPAGHEEVRQKSIDTLIHHQRVLYGILEEYQEIEPSPLYEAYQERVEEPKTDRTVRNYLAKMEQYNLIVANGTSRDRTYCIRE